MMTVELGEYVIHNSVGYVCSSVISFQSNPIIRLHNIDIDAVLRIAIGLKELNQYEI